MKNAKLNVEEAKKLGYEFEDDVNEYDVDCVDFTIDDNGFFWSSATYTINGNTYSEKSSIEHNISISDIPPEKFEEC